MFLTKPYTCLIPCTSIRGTSSRLEVKANFLLITGRRRLSAHSSGSSYSVWDNHGIIITLTLSRRLVFNIMYMYVMEDSYKPRI